MHRKCLHKNKQPLHSSMENPYALHFRAQMLPDADGVDVNVADQDVERSVMKKHPQQEQQLRELKQAVDTFSQSPHAWEHSLKPVLNLWKTLIAECKIDVDVNETENLVYLYHGILTQQTSAVTHSGGVVTKVEWARMEHILTRSGAQLLKMIYFLEGSATTEGFLTALAQQLHAGVLASSVLFVVPSVETPHSSSSSGGGGSLAEYSPASLPHLQTAVWRWHNDREIWKKTPSGDVSAEPFTTFAANLVKDVAKVMASSSAGVPPPAGETACETLFHTQKMLFRALSGFPFQLCPLSREALWSSLFVPGEQGVFAAWSKYRWRMLNTNNNVQGQFSQRMYRYLLRALLPPTENVRLALPLAIHSAAAAVDVAPGTAVFERQFAVQMLAFVAQEWMKTPSLLDNWRCPNHEMAFESAQLEKCKRLLPILAQQQHVLRNKITNRQKNLDLVNDGGCAAALENYQRRTLDLVVSSTILLRDLRAFATWQQEQKSKKKT